MGGVVKRADGDTFTTDVKEADVSGVDKAKDKAQEIKGNTKEAVGEATDNRDLEAEGKKDKAAGNLKQAGEKVKDALR